MLTCTTLGSPERPIVKLQGSLTMEHAREIHAALLKHVHFSPHLVLDLGDTDKSDVSFVQILVALLKNPERNISFTPLPPHLLELAASIGADSLIKNIINISEGVQ
ncbi:MAG: STAS domain-containing protein [Desulfovibrionales bacterium]|nr:STAS domain-containing protein [Desulfovibrionales bacterium]